MNAEYVCRKVVEKQTLMLLADGILARIPPSLCRRILGGVEEMKEICDFCSRQESDNKGGVRCGFTQYEYNGGYGPFKKGCYCIYDADLKDGFSPRTGEEISIKNLSSAREKDQKTILELNMQISELKRRLTSVEL